MSIVDTNKIITGTDQKRFDLAYDSMMENFNEETAKSFYETYSSKSLPFILANAEKIMKEPHYGSSFFLDVADSGFIPLYELSHISDTVNTVIENAKKKNVSGFQIEQYERIQRTLDAIFNEYKNSIKICNMALESDAKDFLDKIYEYFFEIRNIGSDEEAYDLEFAMINYANCPYTKASLLAIMSEIGNIPALNQLAMSISDYMFSNTIDSKPAEINEGKKKVMIFIQALIELGKDEGFLKSINLITFNARVKIKGLIAESISKPEINATLSTEHVNDFLDVMEAVTNGSTDYRVEQFDFLQDMKSYYEAKRDFEIACGNEENVEMYESYIGDIEADIDVLEWTADGEPDPVIKTHITTKKEQEKENAERKALLDKAKEDAINATAVKDDELSKDSDENTDDDDSDEDVTEAVKEEQDGTMSTNSKDVKSEPQKPKEDFATRVQNRAIDHNAAAAEKRAIRKEKNTKLKNAGRAISEQPKGWAKSADDFKNKFDQMDDNRRKRFFLKPGYRKQIFKKLKLALMYGTVAKISVFYLPVAMLVRHMSKNKDRRIRNELVRELDQEIHICEEKISDANSNGDQQEKYKLMRIKGKLEADKVRVQTNSKNI